MPCLWEGLENNWLYLDNPNKSSCTNYSMLLHIQIYLQFLLVQYPPCNGVSNWGNVDVYTNNPDMFIHDDAGWKQGKKCMFCIWAVCCLLILVWTLWSRDREDNEMETVSLGTQLSLQPLEAKTQIRDKYVL